MLLCEVLVWSLWCGAALGAGGGVAVKEEVEKIFKAVEERLSGKPEVKKELSGQNPEASEKMYRVNEDSEDPEVLDEPPVGVSPRVTSGEAYVQPVAFPIGILMSDNLYPLVVGKNVESGKPFVMNLDKQHALVVARASGGGSYKLLIPFPVMLGSHSDTDEDEEDDSSEGEYRNYSPPESPSYLRYGSKSPGKYRFNKQHYHSHAAKVPRRYPSYYQAYEDYSAVDDHQSVPKVPKYAQNYQTYRQYSGEEIDSEDPHTGKIFRYLPKKYLKNRQFGNFAEEEQKSSGKEHYNSAIERPVSRTREQANAYSNYPKKHISYFVAGPKPSFPKKKIILAYGQPTSSLYHFKNQNYEIPGSSYPAKSYYKETAAQHAHRANLYPPKNYPGAYASVPADFKPSPYLGNITEDDAPTRTPKPQGEIYESYDDRGYDFTEQDYLDSINSPDAHSSSGGVRHVTYHADDYLGKIYEEMYYRLPGTQSRDSDRQSTQDFPSASYGVEVTTYSNQNSTETAKPRPQNPASFQQLKTTVTKTPVS